MESLTVIISALSALVGALGGGGLLYFRQNRRLKETEVEAKQSEEWKKLYETSDKDSREKDLKIDALYAERQRLLERLIERERVISQKDIEIERLSFARCDVNECRKRKPPRRYEENNNVFTSYAASPDSGVQDNKRTSADDRGAGGDNGNAA